jgi:two-component system, NtrC family, response regulator AtoC
MPTEAIIAGAAERPQPVPRHRKVAKVLLADSDLASRLTLKSLLGKAGYAVEGAASAAEAISKLDAHQFQLVLADLRSESEEAGPSLLSYARQKEYRPATALIASDMSERSSGNAVVPQGDTVVSMSNENVSYLLANVAELIGSRADRRMRRMNRPS